MAAYIGSHKIDKCYLGTQEIDKVMLGTHEVCSSAVADKPLTGAAANFLAVPTTHTHTNSGYTATMEDERPDRCFPNGQLVPINGYGLATTGNHAQRVAELKEAKAHGFTVGGPHGGVAPTDHLLAAKEAGMEYRPLIREITQAGGGCRNDFDLAIDGTEHSGTCAGGALGKKRNKDKRCEACPSDQIAAGTCYAVPPPVGLQAIKNICSAAMDRWKAVADDWIYGWTYGLDDCGAHMKPTNFSAMMSHLHSHDGQHRPVGDTPLTETVRCNGSHYMPYISLTTEQGWDMASRAFIGDSDGRINCRAAIGKITRQIVTLANQYNSPTGRPRCIHRHNLWAYAWHVVPSENSNYNYIKSEIVHDLLLQFLSGATGIQYYQMTEAHITNPVYTKRTICPEEYHLKKTALYDAMKTLNLDEPVLRALLWGKKTHTHPIHVTAHGNITYTYAISNKSACNDVETGPLIRHADVQFKGERFVVIVNSAPTRDSITWWKAHPTGVTKGQANPAVPAANCSDSAWRTTWGDTSAFTHTPPTPPQYDIAVDVTGFITDATKAQLKVVEVITDTDVTNQIINGKLTTTLAPLECRVYKIMAADGYIGGDQPQPAPAIITHPASVSVHAPAAVSFHVGYTPATASVQWEWQHPVDHLGWKDIPGETGDTYSKAATTTAMSGDQYRAKITTSGNPPVHSNVATMTVTGTAPPVFMPAITDAHVQRLTPFELVIAYNGAISAVDATKILTTKNGGVGNVKNVHVSGDTLVMNMATASTDIIHSVEINMLAGAATVNGVASPPETRSVRVIA